jgi:hypothetical protein
VRSPLNSEGWPRTPKDFLSVFKGKNEGLGLVELKDPRAVLKLIAVMELSVVRGSVDPHFVDDFEPAVSQPAQGIGVTLVFLAMMLVVKLGPDTTRQALIGKEVEGVTEVFITSPALMNVPELASFS